jgi:aminoglycoside phosphotransferase (APT) family kinase protein
MADKLVDRVARVIRDVDGSAILAISRATRRRKDVLVSCASGERHLVRLEDDHRSLLRQRWGYEQLAAAGLPCPRVESFVGPSADFPTGCMVLSWMDAAPAEQIIRRLGPCEKSYDLCRSLGGVLRDLHSVRVEVAVPDYIFTSTRAGARRMTARHVRLLRDAGLVSAAFERKYLDLLSKYVDLIPEPPPSHLCFGDMHFSNVLAYDEDPPRVAGIVDVEEIAMGWPLWDFTNWECWGLHAGRTSQTRLPREASSVRPQLSPSARGKLGRIDQVFTCIY